LCRGRALGEGFPNLQLASWEQSRNNNAQEPGKSSIGHEPESKTSQQGSLLERICKTSISGSNPDGASIFLM
jgi:hypothetical protein